MQRTSGKQIIFWQDVIGDAELIQRHRAHIDKILQGQFQGQMERIRIDKNIYVYVSRLNAADRLLYTTVTIGGRHYLWVLEEVLNHDYQKARFLTLATLKNHLDKNHQALLEMVKKLSQTAAEEKAVELSEAKDIVKFAPFLMECDNGKLLVYNERQEAVWNRLLDEDFAGALLLLGAAGSGKTTIAASVLKDLRRRFIHKERIAFVAKSERLVGIVRQKLIDYPQIECKTIDQIKRELKPALASLKVVGKQQFDEWLRNTHFPALVKQAKAHKDTAKNERITLLKKEIDKIYQECRTISGIGKDAYLVSGKRKTVFIEQAIRLMIYEAYQTYLNYLPINKSYDPSFEELELSEVPIYTFMILDEGLDCSHKDFVQLNRLTKSILVLGDPKQNLYDEISNLTFFIDEMQKTKVFSIEFLLETCRCPANPAEFINKWVMLRNAVMGGVLHELELSVMKVTVDASKPKGEVVWYDGYKQEWIEASKRTQKNTEYAVITYPEYVKEAEQLFGNGLVYTIEDYKGLEDRAIVGYRLLDNELFKEVNALVATLSMDTYVPQTHKPKDWHEKIKFLLIFNSVFTLLSRTTERLYLFQKKHYQLKAITDYLDPPAVKPVVKLEPQVFVTTSEDWQEKIDKLVLNRYMDQARTLYVEKLGKTAAEFEKRYQQTKASDIEIKDKRPVAVDKAPEPASQSKGEQTSPTLAPVKTVQPAKRDKYAYILEIYENLSVANLNKILASPSCLQFLFGFVEKRIKGWPNLLAAIVNNAQKKKIFFDFIKSKKNNEVVLKFKEKLVSGIYQVQLIEASPQHPQAKTTPFNWLGALCLESNDLLIDIIKDYPDLLNNLSQEILHQEVLLGDNESDWLFNCFSFSLKGIELLSDIYYSHDEWLETLPPNALFRTVTSSQGITSSFFNLVSRPRGVSLLSKIFNKHPEWIRYVTLEMLFRQFSITVDQSATAFYYLSTKEGIDLLVNIFKQHDKWLKDFPKDLLYHRIRMRDGSFSSALMCLMASRKGIAFLADIFEQSQGKLIEALPKELFFQRIRLTDGENIDTFYYLVTSREGVALLLKIFEKHLDWYNDLPQKILYEQTWLADGGKASVLFSLVRCMIDNPHGAAFLSHMFKCKPEFYKVLSAAALFQPATLIDGKKYSLFTLLAHSYLSLLVGIIEQNDITEENLVAELFRSIDEYQDTSFRLLAMEENSTTLKAIIKKYPGIVSKIPCALLFNTIVDSKGLKYLSPLAILNRDDCEVIYKIVEAQPDLLKQLTLAQLCERITPFPAHPLIDSLLIMWFESEKGRTLLEKWLLVHPEDKAEVEDIREYQRKKREKEPSSPLIKLSVFDPKDDTQEGKLAATARAVERVALTILNK